MIVGAGPCGLAAAVAAKESGLGHVAIDRGCITESLTHYPYYMTFFSTAERLEIGGVPFTIPEPKPTRREALAYYRHVVAHHGLRVRQYVEVTGVVRGDEGEGAGSPGFVVRTRARDGREGRLFARAVVIATGGFGEPNRLELEGGDPDGRVIHYYKDPYPFFDQDVMVVGGGNSAAEVALELYRNGVRVRMVHFLDVFDRGVKPWVRPDIDNRIASGEIPMHWGSRVARLGPGTATIMRDEDGEATEVANDWVLAMTGWRPNRALAARPGCGDRSRDRHSRHTTPPPCRRTCRACTSPGVIAAGFNANKIFIENGREHGGLIAGHLAGRLGPGRQR